LSLLLSECDRGGGGYWIFCHEFYELVEFFLLGWGEFGALWRIVDIIFWHFQNFVGNFNNFVDIDKIICYYEHNQQIKEVGCVKF
jgi:hypothetical protein